MCMLFDRKEESCPLAMIKADRAVACKELPMRREDEFAAVAAPKNPTDGLLRGFVPRTQPFGSAAAVLH